MSDLKDFRISLYERQVSDLARRLRALADEVERLGRPRATGSITGTPRHLAAAGDVNHAITWAIANMSAYRLMDAAYDADHAEAEADGAK